MTAMLSETDFEVVPERLQSLGYAVMHTAGDEESMMSAMRVLGSIVGARSFGYVHLCAEASGAWLRRHTESLTDGPVPLRYFALGCLVPAVEGGSTYLYDGGQAARLLLTRLPGAGEVRIRYRSAYRPEVSEHPLVVAHEHHGQVLRFRSASEYNTVVSMPAGLDETGMYAVVEAAVTVSLAHVHEWHVGDVLIVDNHRMLHSRAPFDGLRHMLRVRYDDPLHRTVTLGG